MQCFYSTSCSPEVFSFALTNLNVKDANWWCQQASGSLCLTHPTQQQLQPRFFTARHLKQHLNLLKTHVPPLQSRAASLFRSGFDKQAKPILVWTNQQLLQAVPITATWGTTKHKNNSWRLNIYNMATVPSSLEVVFW